MLVVCFLLKFSTVGPDTCRLRLLQFHADSNSRSPCVLFRADHPESEKRLDTLWSFNHIQHGYSAMENAY